MLRTWTSSPRHLLMQPFPSSDSWLVNEAASVCYHLWHVSQFISFRPRSWTGDWYTSCDCKSRSIVKYKLSMDQESADIFTLSRLQNTGWSRKQFIMMAWKNIYYVIVHVIFLEKKNMWMILVLQGNRTCLFVVSRRMRRTDEQMKSSNRWKFIPQKRMCMARGGGGGGGGGRTWSDHSFWFDLPSNLDERFLWRVLQNILNLMRAIHAIQHFGSSDMDRPTVVVVVVVGVMVVVGAFVIFQWTRLTKSPIACVTDKWFRGQMCVAENGRRSTGWKVWFTNLSCIIGKNVLVWIHC